MNKDVKKRYVIFIFLMQTGCSTVYYPEIPGPADKVNCSIHRENSTTGTCKCEFEGKYQFKQADLF